MQVKFSSIGTEPILLAEAKTYCRLGSSTDDDAYLTEVIKNVRGYVESVTNRSLVIKTIQVFYDEFYQVIKLPYPEHDEITACTLDGVDILSSIYQTGLTRKIITVPSLSSSGLADDLGLLVTYTTTGFVPEGLKNVMLKMVQELYDNRGNGSFEIKENIKYDTLMLIQPYIYYEA